MKAGTSVLVIVHAVKFFLHPDRAFFNAVGALDAKAEVSNLCRNLRLFCAQQLLFLRSCPPYSVLQLGALRCERIQLRWVFLIVCPQLFNGFDQTTQNNL